MVLATSNKARRLLDLSFIGRVQAAEVERGTEDVRALLAELPPNFRLLVDLSRLDFMELECRSGIGQVMDLINQAQVGLIVRVIPDSSKDIGFNILTAFHYSRRPRIVTCASMVDAGRTLAL